MVALILCYCMSAIKYEQEVFRVLTEAGEEGLAVQKIALHVYNACNSLFNPRELRRGVCLCFAISHC